jgi:transcription elongation factor SPT6
MYNAEMEGLIEISVRVGDEERLMDDIIKNFCNDYSNEYAEAWNDERRRVAQTACKTIIFPQVAKWVKEKLYTNASEFVANQCKQSFHNVSLAYYIIFYSCVFF